QAFDAKDELIVEGRFGLLRKAADAYADALCCIETRYGKLRKDRDHSGCEPAVRNDVYAGIAGFGVEGKLLIDDRVVAAKIAEIRSGSDRRTRERDVVPIVHAGDDGAVAAHQFDGGRLVGRIERNGRDPAFGKVGRNGLSF